MPGPMFRRIAAENKRMERTDGQPLADERPPLTERPEIRSGGVLADPDALRELTVVTASIAMAQQRIREAQGELAFWIRQAEMLLSTARPEVTGLTFQLWQHKSSKKLYAVRGQRHENHENDEPELTGLFGPLDKTQIHADLRGLAYDPAHEDMEWVTRFPREFQIVKG